MSRQNVTFTIKPYSCNATHTSDMRAVRIISTWVRLGNFILGLSNNVLINLTHYNSANRRSSETGNTYMWTNFVSQPIASPTPQRTSWIWLTWTRISALTNRSIVASIKHAIYRKVRTSISQPWSAAGNFNMISDNFCGVSELNVVTCAAREF